MVNLTFLAGGYASFIAAYQFNTDTFSLALLDCYPSGTNVSWISLHPFNSSILYAVNEVTEGALQSYVVGDDGSVSGPIDTVSSGGDGPAYTGALTTGQVAIMNYQSGNGMIIPTTTDPLHFSRDASLITFPPPSYGVSHPHEAIQYGSEVFVPDLGGNKIWSLVQGDSPGTWDIQGLVAQPYLSGPRHMAINNGMLYLVHETASILSVQGVPAPPNGTSAFVSYDSTIPATYPNGSVFAAAEIQIPPVTPEFPVPYLYTSNRNTGNLDPRGDTIVIWAIRPDGGVEQVRQVYTGLDQIRGMMLSTLSDGIGEYLVASGVAGEGGVLMYQRVAGGSDLRLVASNLEVPTRTTFVWLP